MHAIFKFTSLPVCLTVIMGHKYEDYKRHCITSDVLQIFHCNAVGAWNHLCSGIYNARTVSCFEIRLSHVEVYASGDLSCTEH